MVKHTIDHYISNLLYYNECVVVPGFGAFLTRYYPAEINSATHMFRPPSKRVAFNARIQENDGLLAKYIAKTEQVSYEKAVESIDISMRSWKKLLRAGKKVNLTGIGRLYMSDTGKLQFNPAHDINYDINSYGLNIFRANAMDRDLEIKRSVNKAIEKHQVKKDKVANGSKTEPVVREFNMRRWVSVLGPVAAILALGAYVYVNPGVVNTAQQQVSGIFLSDSSFKFEETYSPNNIADSESSIGFSEGERLNGEYGPEDDVLSEVETETDNSSEEIAEEPVKEIVEEKPVVANKPSGLKKALEKNDTDYREANALKENLNPKSSDNAVSDNQVAKVAMPKQHNPVKGDDLMEDNYFLPEKPLYHVKKRPDHMEEEPLEQTSNDTYGGYSYATDLNPAGSIGTAYESSEEKPKEELEPKTTVGTSAPAEPIVKTTKPEQKPAPVSNNIGKTYQVIVGAFSNQGNAEKYAKQLQANGWVSYTYFEGNLHRVAIGKLDNREQADRLLKQVKLQVNARAWVNLK